MRRIGKAATSKVAGRKAMGVRVPLSPPDEVTKDYDEGGVCFGL